MSASVAASTFERAVPFHLVVDRHGHVVRAGRLLHHVCTGLQVGSPAGNHLRLVGSDQDALVAGDLESLAGKSLVLELRTRPLRLRAELVIEGDVGIFLAHPLLTNARQLEALDLTLADLPPSHPVGDYLTLLRSIRGSLRETRDLTDRLANQQVALEEARRASEAASEAKTRFLATTSHELRTPLHGVLGLLDACLDEDLDPLVMERLGLARGAARSLLGLLDDLLDLAKVEAGELRVEAVPVSISALLDDVAAVIQPRASVPVRVRVSPGVPTWVTGDPTRIRQILLNLAGNAARFTEDGHITLTVTKVVQPGSDLALAFTVSDTGPGIPADALAGLFQAFRQVSTSTARTHGGTGLGLTISKELVELMGGTIDVESTVGRGTSFRARIPLGHAVEPRPSDNDEISVVPDLSGHVLVAEDNPVNQVVVRLSLRALGVRCVVVGDGEAAVRAATEQPFDLVLMDVHMPRLDGLAATSRLRELRPALPIVGLTASTLDHEIQACLDAGMDAVLGKPFQRGELARVLSRWLVDDEPSVPPGQAA